MFRSLDRAGSYGKTKRDLGFFDRAAPYAGAVSGFVLGGILANVPGAVVGAKMGYERGKNFTKKKSMAAYTMKRKNSVTSSSVSKKKQRVAKKRARPMGSRKKRRGLKRFNRKKRKYRKTSKKSRYLAKTHGYEYTVETYGKINDPNCVYLKHSTHYVEMLAKTICGAMIRKIFSMAGYQLGDSDQVLSTAGPGSTDGGWRLIYSYMDPGNQSATQLPIFTSAGGVSLDTILDTWTALTDHYQSLLINGIQVSPLSLTLQMEDQGAISSAYRTECQLLLQNEVLNVQVWSHLRVQNRTLNPSGTNDVEVVDNQPLTGKLYTFKHADPRVAFSTYTPSSATTDQPINGIHTKGIEGVRGASLPVKYQEPPAKSKFQNCVSVVPVQLPVGDTKECKFGHKFTGKFQGLMERLRPERGFITNADIGKTFLTLGKSQMLAFEETIKTANTQPITVGYERQYTVGAWLVTRKPIHFMSRYVTQNLDYTS